MLLGSWHPLQIAPRDKWTLAISQGGGERSVAPAIAPRAGSPYTAHAGLRVTMLGVPYGPEAVRLCQRPSRKKGRRRSAGPRGGGPRFSGRLFGKPRR